MATTVTEQEIRQDFAGRLMRRFDRMQESAKCKCGAEGDAHVSGCPIHHWRLAAVMTREMLATENEEGDAG